MCFVASEIFISISRIPFDVVAYQFEILKKMLQKKWKEGTACSGCGIWNGVLTSTVCWSSQAKAQPKSALAGTVYTVALSKELHEGSIPKQVRLISVSGNSAKGSPKCLHASKANLAADDLIAGCALSWIRSLLVQHPAIYAQLLVVDESPYASSASRMSIGEFSAFSIDTGSWDESRASAPPLRHSP